MKVNEQPSAPTYLTLSNLKERGWTRTLIRDLLGQEDATRPNPYYRTAPPVRLYLLDRVQSAEQSEQWTERIEKVAKRKVAASAGDETKRRNMANYLETVQITVPILADDALTKRACESYNDRQLERGNWECDLASPKSDAEFLMRIKVNYLRHELSEYEMELDAISGKVGVQEAYHEINKKVYDAIGTAYPNLEAECKRQSERKFCTSESATAS
jgi:hypothetical protein